MAIRYPPKVGEILVCEFPACFSAPEMLEKRLVVVVGPRLAERDARLVNVVPISMTPPSECGRCHVEIPLAALPQPWQAARGRRWAKCDMIYALSTARLDLVLGARNRAAGGRRQTFHGRVDPDTLRQIRRCAAHAMGIAADLWPP